ncbi:MAG: hypothetical protein ABI347_09545 [Nitrososphaera sp.]
MRLRRGHWLLVASSALIIISIAVAAPYIARGAQAEYVVGAGKTVEIRREINSGDGIFNITFQELKGSSPKIAIRGPSNQTVYSAVATSFIMTGPVNATAPGNYTLSITNPSTETLRMMVLFGEQEPATVASGFIQIAGIIVLVAGGIVTVIDSRREKRMKQFGDVSDLR